MHHIVAVSWRYNVHWPLGPLADYSYPMILLAVVSPTIVIVFGEANPARTDNGIRTSQI